MDQADPTVLALQQALEAANRRAEQAEQALEAIYSGAADAIVVPAGSGPQVFIREGADRPYRQIVELMAQGVAVCDGEGAVLRANHALADLLDRPADGVLGRHISGIFAPESVGPLEALVASARSGAERPETGILQLSGPDGAPLPAAVAVSGLDLDGQSGFLVTVADLSHQKRDDELLASERLARSIIDQAVDAIVVCDPDGRVMRASREAHRLCGGNPLRRRFVEAFALRHAVPGDVSATAAGPPLAPAELFGDEPIRNLEVTLSCQDEPVVLLLSSGPIRDEDGRRLAHVVTLTDVTPQKRAEARLLEADRRKDEFLAMLAHELRNPLAALAYGVALLRDGDDAGGELLAILDRQVHHMRWMVDDLLDVARLEKGRIVLRPEPVDLAELAGQAARAVAPAVSTKGHELTLALEPRPLWVLGDPTRLEQVLVNLLANAAKYTPPGGRIWLDAGPDPERPGRMVVSVRDDGVGLTPEMRARVFELFAQADRSLDRQEGGLGIGLTLVRRLVELHGGSVEVSSDGPGQGSMFTVRLPATVPPEDVPTPAPGAPEGRPRHVLLVDDNRDMARTLRRLLEAEGHRVDLAHDGPSGLEAAERLRPEVLVLDLGLPGIDGFELASRLRASPLLPGRRLIALSGYGGVRAKDQAIAAGFDRHLTKPVDLPTLGRLIREAPDVPDHDHAGPPRPDPGPVLKARDNRPKEAPAEAPSPTYRILLVEDQEALSDVARRVLQRRGHVVEVAADGPTALEIVRRFSPEVVLCDLHLDGPMDGFAIARALRLDPAFAEVPLIALTARDGEAIRTRSLDAGFDLHLTKPVDFTEVPRYVELARRR